MNDILNRKQGCWIVGGVAFEHKLTALRYASETNNANIEFYYHNHIWENFNRRLLGKISLSTLYKERAQQLRDTYDHLVLHYSGGSDSHNILHTFLTNNIKLDEISVRWSKPLRDGKFYTPNKNDTSARNGVSEWDYAIKPELDRVSSLYPNIKITLVDFTDNLKDNLISVANIEKRVFDLNFYRGSLGGLTQRLDSDVEKKVTVAHNRKKIAHIYGIEKPYVVINDNNIDFCFQDSQLDPGIMPLQDDSNSVEYFYWSPDYPLLPFEQAYQLGLRLKYDEHARDMFYYEHLPLNDPNRRIKVNAMNNINKEVLYKDSWDFNKFQAGKPNASRSDWWFWLHETPELNSLHSNFLTAMKNLTQGIDERLILTSQNIHTFVPTRGKYFNLMTLN